MSLEDITSHEVQSGKKPNISHLKIFGYIAYAHVSYQRKTKLDDKSLKYIFIGHNTPSKAYKLFISKELKVHISRDLEFHEDGV